jgi:hypothetical protein
LDARPVEGARAVGISQADAAAWESFHVPVMPGSRVRLEAKVRCEDCTGHSRIELLMLGGSGWPFCGLAASDSVSGSSPWSVVSMEVDVPDRAAYLRVRLSSENNDGRVAFDDVRLTVAK